MFRFITEGPDNPSGKRKQSQRACDHCRSRKKRCVHVDDSERIESSPVQDERRRSSRMQGPKGQTADTTSVHVANSQEVNQQASPGSSVEQINLSDSHSTDANEHADSWFVGDLNPEGIFLSMASPDTISSSSGGVGVWLFRRPTEKESHETTQPLLKAPHAKPGSGLLPAKLFWKASDERCLRVLPNAADRAALVSIYSEEIHPIFPVVDIKSFSSMQEKSLSKNILTQAICLAASSNRRAERFLSLSSEPATLSSKAFIAQLSSAIRLSLDLRLVTDKFILIQVLTLLSLFSQLSAENHDSADLLCQAVSYTHTLGLHLQSGNGAAHNQRETELFCCLWALDRLNAAFHGRPVMMHERDISRDLEACFQQQPDPFKLVLRTVLLLDKVIDLYRPSSSVAAVSGWESTFPPFQELLNSSCSSQTSPHLLATAETLYHAVAMLSCRPQSLEEPVRSSPSYVRQCLSADKVTSIVGEEFRGQLSKFPIVPYAVSLVLRFHYRELRLSKAPYFRSRARKDLLRTCAILRPFGDFYSSATAMAQMVEETIREMDRACSSMANTQHNTGLEGVTPNPSGPCSAETSAYPTFADSSAGPSTCRASEQPLESESNIPNQQGVGGDPQPILSTDVSGFEPTTLFDNVPGDIDIFEYLDPGFDLSAIDAAIGGGVNGPFPTFPING